jgi:hypothetical protein
VIEIIVLFRLCSSLGKKLREKGRNPTGMQFLLVILWFTGEISGGIAGFVIGSIAAGDNAGAVFAIGGALCGAIAGAVGAFQIAKAMQPAYAADDIDRDNAYGPGWRERDRERLRRRDQRDGKTAGDGITDRPEDLPRRQVDDRIEE